MSLILHIDTALEKASIALSQNADTIAISSNEDQKDHAAWMHPAIGGLMLGAGFRLQDLEAISVSIGPGSYTGLRVGLAAAKGFCYGLDIPLIAVGSLEIIANSVKEQATDLVCPMIDARRMEVYAALYEKDIVEKIPPFAALLDESSFADLLSSRHILFCGNGSQKLQSVLTHPHASFMETGNLMNSHARIAYKSYTGNKFAVLAYTEPLYVKEFYTVRPKD